MWGEVMDLGNLLSINFTKFIEKYFFPMNYLPFILIIVIIILSLLYEIAIFFLFSLRFLRYVRLRNR